MSDELSQLFGDTPEESETAPEQAQPEQPEQATPPEQAPPAPEGETAPAAPPAEPVAPSGPPPGFVPQGALDDERHKRRNAEQEAERLRQASQPQAQAPAIPDPVEDPQGFEAWQVQREQAITWQAVTSTSMMLANQTHTPEVVQEAAQAFAQECEQKPWLVQELRRQQHPYDWVVNRHKRESALANMSPERLAAFQAWEAAQTPGAPPPASAPAYAPAAPQSTAQTPPRSINAAPSAGGVTHEPEPADPFDAVFPKR